MIQYLHCPRPHRSAIDDLSLLEQEINLLNGPVIFLQILRILDPQPLRALFDNDVFCWIVEAVVLFAYCHRALGGMVIAGVRQVPWP